MQRKSDEGIHGPKNQTRITQTEESHAEDWTKNTLRVKSHKKNKQANMPRCLQSALGAGWGMTETQRGLVGLITTFIPVQVALHALRLVCFR